MTPSGGWIAQLVLFQRLRSELKWFELLMKIHLHSVVIESNGNLLHPPPELLNANQGWKDTYKGKRSSFIIDTQRKINV